jgi:hypothetical protein
LLVFLLCAQEKDFSGGSSKITGKSKWALLSEFKYYRVILNFDGILKLLQDCGGVLCSVENVEKQIIFSQWNY